MIKTYYKTAASLITIFLIFGCGSKNEIKAPGVNKSDDSAAIQAPRPDQVFGELIISLYNGSLKSTDVKADSVEKFVKLDSTNAWNLDVYFYDDSGYISSHLIADSGLIRESLNWMIANGNVVVIRSDSNRLETEQLIWHGNNGMITSDSFVTIYQYGDTLQGYGLETDRELRRIKIKRQVTGTAKNIDAIDD